MQSSQTSFKYIESKTIKEKIQTQKKFIIKMNDNKYRLTIIKYDKCIQLKVNNINNLNLYYYQNIYTFKNIIDIFKLDINLYYNFDKVMDLIKDAYLNNNILLKLFNNNINLIIRYNNYECIFTLNKYDLEINEKIDIVINEINNIRKNKNISLIKNKLEQLEKILDDLKKSIYRTLIENKESIHLLKNEISKNLFSLNDNKKLIQLLNSELENLNKKFDEFKEKVKNKLNNINNTIQKEKKEEKSIRQFEYDGFKEKSQNELNNMIQKEKKEEKNDDLYIINEINRDYYKIIQITVFSTNNTERKSCNIFDNFLKNNIHSMVEKADNKIDFNIQLVNSNKPIKIKIYSIFNFDDGIEDNIIDTVSCYVLFIDLDNDIKEDYKLNLENIKHICNNQKKLYILGMFNGNEGKRYIYEEDILQQLYDIAFEYEYLNINISDEKHMSEIIMKILLYCSEHPIVSENEIEEKNIKNYSKNYKTPLNQKYRRQNTFQHKTYQNENNSDCIII